MLGKSQAIVWFFAKPMNPKEIHTPGASAKLDSWTNIGMIDTKNPHIPVRFSTFLSNGRSQHNVWTMTRRMVMAMFHPR